MAKKTRWDKEVVNRQTVVIGAIIVVSFLVAIMLFYGSSYDIALSYAKTVDNYAMTSALLDVDIDGSDTDNAVALTVIEQKYDVEVVFLDDSSNAVIFAAEGSQCVGETLADDVLVQKALEKLSSTDDETEDDETEEDETDTDVAYATSGGGFFAKNQRVVEVRHAKDLGAYVIVLNEDPTIFVEQREQMSALVVVMMLTLGLVLFLITYLISIYRRRIIRLATTDEVTGLANRKSFVKAYEDEMAAGRLDGATSILLDVDFFKRVNDSFGHAMGDEALRFVSEKVARLVEGCGIAGRWGGDEFIAVIEEPAAVANRRIESLISDVASGEITEGLRLSVSVGAARIGAATPLNSAVEMADEALYVSKKNGRGFLTVYKEGVTPKVAYDDGILEGTHEPTKDTPQLEAAADGISSADIRATDAHTASVRLSIWKEKLLEATIAAVRRMVPFIAGGGLLIAVAFLVDAASVDLSSLATSERSSFGSITPLASTLYDVGQAAFGFMLPIFAGSFASTLIGPEAFMAGFVGGYIVSDGNAGFVGGILAGLIAAGVVWVIRGFVTEAGKGVQSVAPILIYPVMSLLATQLLVANVINPAALIVDQMLSNFLYSLIDSNRVLFGAVLGAFMAFDLGGPVNKAAYYFGVTSIGIDRPDIMAAVMVGGMVPPCAITTAIVLFRNNFTTAERAQMAPTLMMGLGFITEGALPFALSDLLHVIPACIGGSAVAGALCEAFGCELMAPHGGIFVLPVATHALALLVSLAAGSLVGALVFGACKGWLGWHASG